MITRCRVYIAPGFDPYENLAVEETLLKSAAEGDCVLYLWQNERTVVIGRNQNPWKECRTALLEEEGGSLARRLSGGGAVFHDRGNLNVSFLVGEKDFDVRGTSARAARAASSSARCAASASRPRSPAATTCSPTGGSSPAAPITERRDAPASTAR